MSRRKSNTGPKPDFGMYRTSPSGNGEPYGPFHKFAHPLVSAEA